jgi:hypothetical protein
VYNPGESILPADLAQGFDILNDMLDSWSNENATTYAVLEQSLTFTPGIYQYTIGTGAFVDTTRPLRLLLGFGAAYVMDQTSNRYPLEVITQDRWNEIGNISQVNANIPMYLWYDPQYPCGVLNFFPIPNIGYQAFWDSYLQFTRFDTIDTDANLPPGYTMAIKRNLALELAPFYPNAVVSQRLTDAAERSKGNVKRTNFRETIAKYDPELVSKSRATYNIYRDVGT